MNIEIHMIKTKTIKNENQNLQCLKTDKCKEK